MVTDGGGLPERSTMRWTGSRARLCCCNKVLAAKGQVMVRHDAMGDLAWHDSGVVRSDPSRRAAGGLGRRWTVAHSPAVGRHRPISARFWHVLPPSAPVPGPSQAISPHFHQLRLPTCALTAAEFISCSSLSCPFLAGWPSSTLLGPESKLDEPASQPGRSPPGLVCWPIVDGQVPQLPQATGLFSLARRPPRP